MPSRAASRFGSVAVLLVLFSAPGFAGDGVAGLQSADATCPGFSAEEIYHPCDNGTVTDNRTNLVWLADTNCLHGMVDWYTAMEFVSGLAQPSCGLSDNSQPGDWRLPTAGEWREMTGNANGDPGDLDCDPAISNDFDNSCWTSVCHDVDLCSFHGVESGLYWAANPVLGIGGEIAYAMALDEGGMSAAGKISKDAYVWPVRPAQSDGVVALQAAAASCGDDSGAWYVDCENGTFTDSRSGLVWLKNADCLGADVDWHTAMGFVAGLADHPEGSIAADDDCGLSDGSSPGDWRLPSWVEWWAMVQGAVGGALDCTPVLSNDLGDGCWSQVCWAEGECSFFNVHTGHYWAADTSETRVFEVADVARILDSEDGDFLGQVKWLSYARLWPVRGGQ